MLEKRELIYDCLSWYDRNTICKELMQKGKLIYRRKEIWRGSMKRYSIIFIRWD